MDFSLNSSLWAGIFLFSGLFSFFKAQNPQNPSEMSKTYDLAEHMRTYGKYNLWANQQMANWLKDISEDRARQEIESSFPSIRETVFHLWFSEYGWSQKIQTGEWERPDSAKINQSTAKIWEELVSTSREIVREINSYDEEDWFLLHERGQGQKVKRLDIFHQLFNHATYHRGQCITMGRQLGLEDPPRTDYLYYISQK